jgi:RNA polymerase-interacting CarD/CdnL/TRCF family regulator
MESSNTPPEYSPGSSVVYAMHGRCNVISVESREVGGETIRFYKLEVQRSPLSRSTRKDPAIWLPVSAAREKGLRDPLSASNLDAIYTILGSREYYFSAAENWGQILPKLEFAIRTEGAAGLAKVVSYLHVLRKREIVLSTEIVRFEEQIRRLLTREISEITQETARIIEERFTKLLRNKTLPDH